MYLNWKKYNIDVPANRASGQYKTTCPNCRDTRGNPRDKSLSCNLADGTFICHHCDWRGCVAEEEEWEKEQRKEQWKREHSTYQKKKKKYELPTDKGNAKLSDRMLAYFKSRGISEKTLSECGVTEGVESMPPRGDSGQWVNINTIHFNYYLNGELVNTKFRAGYKKFKLVSGARLIPYNIDSIKGQKYCCIVEGEMDCLTLHEIGYTSVVSVPSGANSNLEWLDDFVEDYFDDKEVIYIASDTDTKGVMLKDELLRRFGNERCKVVTDYGEDCKDANDCLQKYGAEFLKGCIEKADFIPIEGVFNIRDFENDLDALYDNGLKKGCTLGFPNFDQYCSFETKRLCIVTGIPGMGKSEFIDQMAERLNVRHGWKCAFFSPENAPKQIHASKLMEKFTGHKFGRDTLSEEEYEHAKDYMSRNTWFIYPTDNFKLDNILAKAKYLVRRYGVKLVVIDPYNRLESEQGNQSETKYISELLDKLTNFAQINDVLIVLMAHPAKQPKNKDGRYDAPTLYDISGSANFFNKADFGLSIHRNREEQYTEVHIQKVKFRHLGQTGMVTFKYNTNNGRYIPYNSSLTSEVYRYDGMERKYIQEYSDTNDFIWDNSNHIGFERKNEIEPSTPQPTQQLQPNTSFDTPKSFDQEQNTAYDAQFANDDILPF